MSVENLSGNRLGQYDLRDLLGSGGMGAVYLAHQSVLDRLVAVKVLNVSLTANPEYLERFRREAKTSAGLEHPHIVPVYDYGTQGNISYVVMRLLTGGSLAERITHSRETKRPLPSLTETAQIVKQLASALDYAHGRGVIHRDVKTSNVMFDEQGTAFLVDFGIAKLTYATSALTGTGMAMGTPSYMAPEQWRGEDVQPTVDQYSLGVMVYAILTGRLPFEAETPFALMHKHLNEEPTPINAFRTDLAEPIRDVVKRTMAKTPEERFATCGEFATAFENAVRGVTAQAATGFFVTPLPARPPSVSRSPGYDDVAATSGLPARPELETGGGGGSAAPIARTPTPFGMGIDGPTTTGAPILPRTESASGGSRTPMIIGAVIAILGMLSLGALLIISQQNAATGQATETEIAALALAVAQETETAEAIPTATATATMTETATETATDTITPSSTATDTATLEPIAAAQVTRNAFMTATATGWTKTPTPDSEATLEAALTALYYDELTSTARSWTATFTSTATPTATRTPSATITPSATATQTATFTPTETPTVNVRAVAASTREAILTATAAQWTPTDTPDVDATLNAELTALFEQDLTATATLWTPTPTPTFTATYTATLTPIPSNTARPTPTFTATLVPTNTLIPASATPAHVTCPGTQTTRLYPGDTGIVLGDDPRPLRVRNGASAVNTVIVDLIETGERFTVIEGPRCNEGFAWLRIRYHGQQEGWAAEGDSSLYFVGLADAPLPPTRLPGDADLRPNCQVILEEQFETRATPYDWFVQAIDRYTVAIRDGAYMLLINEIVADNSSSSLGENEQTLWGSLRGVEFDDATIEARIRGEHFTQSERSRTGLWLRYQNENEFMAFMLRGDGAFRIARWEGGEYTDLIPWTRANAIYTGDNAQNLLRIDSKGDRFTFFINGELMATVNDDTWDSGRVVFWGSTSVAPANFYMDYFRACEN